MAFFDTPTFMRPHAHVAGDHCPTCDQPIPNDRVAEIRRRAEARERQVQTEAEARLKEQAARALEIERAQFAAREQAVRAEAQKLAADAYAQQINEAATAKAAAEQRCAELQAAQEAAITARVAEAREALEKSRADAVHAEQAKYAAERIKLESMVSDLQRKLQDKSVKELGEGAEIDLFEALKAAFPSDIITRVKRGASGADVIHEIRHNGAKCGVVVYDSKNHLQWRTEHATKLREDQIEAKADHAVLATRAFPKDQRELHIEHGVVLVNPARTVIVAMLLRQQIVQLHFLRASNDQRATKTEELYALMTSDRFAQFLVSIEKAAKQLEALQESERKSHETAWKKQAELYRMIIRTCAGFDETVARIIGTAASAGDPE